MKKKETTNKKCKVTPSDRLFMQKLFSGMKELSQEETFPTDERWKKIFYRKVDTLEGERGGDELRRVEEKLFIEVVKEEVEGPLGPWEGSQDQNRLADKKLAFHVKTVLHQLSQS